MPMSNFAGVSGNHLKQFIERIERLEEEKAALQADIKEVFAEAKSQGFEVKIIRQILKIRKMDHDERMEMEELVTVYLNALNMAGPKLTSVDGDVTDTAA